MFDHRLATAVRSLAAVVLVLGVAAGSSSADNKKSKDTKKAKDAPAQAADPLHAQLEGKSPQEKIDALNGIVDAGQATKEVWFQLGNAKFESGDTAGAATAFEKAVAMDSTYFKAVVNLGLMYDEQQNFSKAIETFEQAGRLEPNNPDVWSHMGNTYTTQGNYAKASELYRKALKLDPNAVHALYSMGVAFADAGIFREAVHYWTRVTELDPKGELGKNASENVELVKKYLIP
jgi:cytochrome c-type biogenesis protein CcmH/NrfG